MIRPRWRRCVPGLACGLLVAWPPALAQPLIAAPQPPRLPPPSAALLRSLQGFQHDLELLDRSLLPGSADPADAAEAQGPASAEAALLQSLPAPAVTALPTTLAAVRIQRRQRLTLAEALLVALRNDPDLAATVLDVREQ